MRVTAAAALLALAACGSASHTVTGLVIDVQGDLEQVDAFTLLVDGGGRLELTPAAEGAFDFPLPHLREHLRSGEPVEVTYREESGRLLATRVGDA